MTSTTPRAPTPFGKYLLDGQIAEGGMARVFLARLRGPGGFEKRLVVKQILPKFAREPAFVDLFVREANTLVQMSHPHIVPVYELGVVDGVYFLALEWVEGVTLLELMRRAELPPEMVVHVAVQICEALRYAFGRFDVVHRDVTPRNIMVDRDGHARLLDFGIAASVAETGGGDLFGSAGFMAPEQLRGDSLDARTDLFALGAVLYQGLTGRPAFPDRQAARKAETLGEATPMGDDVDPQLSAIVMRMLASDPAGRPDDASVAGRELRGWLAGRRPDGVAQELGQQVMQVQASHPRPLTYAGDSDGESGESGDVDGTEPLSDGSSSSPKIQTIATSVDLDNLIQQATERIESRPPSALAESTGEQGAGEATEAIPRAISEATSGGDGTQPLAKSQATHAAAAERRGMVRFAWPVLAVLVAAGLWLADPGSPPASRPAVDRSASPVVEPPQPPPAAAIAPDAGTATAAIAGGDPRLAPATGSPSPIRPSRARDAGAVAPGPRRGRLSVNALPWGKVQIDGRDVGTTPLRGHALPAGKHTVRVECPPLGRVASTSVDVPPGGTARILVDLNRDPPAITLGGG